MSGVHLAGLSGARVVVAAERIAELAARVDGHLLHAGDDGFDRAAVVWNGTVAKAPGLVLQPTAARGVAAAVDFARNHGVLLGIGQRQQGAHAVLAAA